MSNNQKDITTPTKSDSNQNKNGQDNKSNQKKDNGTKPSEATETNEKMKPGMGAVEQEREETEHPHKTADPVAEKEEKSNK